MRVEASISKPLNGLQGGFRLNICCNMTSIMVSECIFWQRKTIVNFLLASSIYKKLLTKCGCIRLKLLGIVIELHTYACICIVQGA